MRLTNARSFKRSCPSFAIGSLAALGSAVAIIVVLGLSAPSAWAQVSLTGQITGIVEDASEAVVSGATVTAKNTSTNVTTQTVTSESGLYTIFNVIPGTYTVTVEQPGFKKSVQENVVVGVDTIVRVDAPLEVGAVTEEITVTGVAPLLKTERADVSETIERREVQNLPTLGRNVTRLQLLAPGAVVNFFQLSGHPENSGEDYRVGFNGQHWGNANRQLDGVDNNEVIQGLSMMVPSQDSVQEIKLTTSNYDAEYGTVAGAVIQISTRSGTNDIHGSAFEYYRSSGMFARNPFTEPEKPASFIWHQFGGSMGGPVRKDKIFLFGDFQGMRTTLGGSSLVTSPVQAFRDGDFSALAATNPIFDPLTGNPDGTGRVQFNNNIIPQNRISSAAQNLHSLVPPPTDPSKLDNNFTISGRGLYNVNQFSTRGDYYRSDKTRVFGRYSLFRTAYDTPNVFGPIAGGRPLGGIVNSGLSGTQTQSLAFNYARVISPTFLTDFRFGFSRLRIDVLNFDHDLKTASQAGIPGVNIGPEQQTNGLPRMAIQGPVGSFDMGSFGGPFFERETVFNLATNWTKVVGKHTMKWGADIKKVFFIRTDANGRGTFSFSQSVTGSADAPGSGLGVASFLLGLPSSYTRRIQVVFPQEKQWRDGIYFQDNWKATKKLSLSLGLRWEYHSPMFTSLEGGLTNLDLETGMILLANLHSKYAGVDPVFDEISPRFGLAYQVKEDTVIRLGFGRSYAISVFGATFATQAGGFPNAQPQELSQVNPFTPIIRFQDGPPAPAPIPALPANGETPLPPGVGMLAFGTGPYPHQYTDSWNFTVQHQIRRDTTVELAYVGNVSRQIWSNWNVNMPFPGPGDFNSRRPYFERFGWAQAVGLRRAGMKANYHSLQARLEKKFSDGFSVMSNFTWSKAIDEGSFGPAYQFDILRSRGGSDFTRNVVSITSFLWELPFSGATGAARHLLEGWNINGIVNLQSGRYITPSMANNASLNSPLGLRPDRTGSGEVSNPTREKWFDVTAFRTPPLYTYGDSGRAILFGPGLASVDLTVYKRFQLTEQLTMEFRGEAFNLFNRTNLTTPATAIDTATGGTITGIFHPMRRMQIGAHLRW